MASININKIFKSGILVDLNIRFWAGQVKLNPDDLGFNNGEISNRLISLGKKNLIPADERKEFRRVEGRARHLLRSFSFDFPISQARFVPESALPEVLDQLNKLKDEYNKKVKYFVGHYVSIRNKMLKDFRKNMPRIYATTSDKKSSIEEFTERFMTHITSLYPDKAEVRAKFAFEWELFEVSMPNFKKRSDRFLAKQAELNKQLALEYQRKARTAIDGFLSDVVSTLRDQTVTTCSFVVNKIKNGEVVSEKNLNSLRKFIDRFEKLNFMGDKTIEKQLENLRTSCLSGDYNYKNNKDAIKHLKENLESVIDHAKSITDVSVITGNWKRKIKF